MTPTATPELRTAPDRSARMLRLAAEVADMRQRLYAIEHECGGMGLNFQPASVELTALEGRMIEAR